MQYAETIKDTSAKMGVSMEATQRWKFAAEQTGASLENVSKSVLKLSQGIDGGDKGLKQALAAAGVQMESLRGMRPEDAFDVVAAAIAKIPDPMTQARVALEAFGKSGAELLPALRDGFDKLADSAPVMADRTINALDRAKDAWDKLGQSVVVVSGSVIAEVIALADQMFKSTERLATFAQILLTQGPGAAMAMASAIDAAENSTSKAGKTFEDTSGDVDLFADAANGLSFAMSGAYVTGLRGAVTSTEAMSTATRKVTKDLEVLIPKIPMASNAFATLKNVLRDMGTLGGNGLALPPLPPLDLEVRADPLQIIRDVRNALILAGKSTELKGAAAGVGAEVGAEVVTGFSKAMERVGLAIIGAIQGGGDVSRAAFSAFGQSLGEDLGTKIASGIGGTFGKALGSLAGPLGALVGDFVGKLFSKAFGNAGRDSAKDFAASMGGFDALREKMLVLGDEGERMWVRLTQNAGSAAQVAGTIDEINAALARYAQSGEGVAGATYQTKAALETLAAQAKATYDYMLKSGLYTASTLAEAWKKYEDAQKLAVGMPTGAMGFPTKAQLDQSAKDAEAAYVYMRDSGLYTADVLEQAWDQWQDALIASGDAGTKALRDINAEMKTLQEAIAEELPEYDAEGVRIYGVIEQQNIDRLAKLEAEKAKIILAGIEEKVVAEEEAAATAEASAQLAFERAATNAKTLDDELRDIFSKGYDIPFRFNVPGMPPSGGTFGGAMAEGGSGVVDKPTWFLAGEAGREQYAFSGAGKTFSGGGGGTVNITVVSQLDGREVARNQVRYIPSQLALAGL